MSERSPIFELLVGTSDQYDVDNLVAYSLYKQHKREWCVEFEQDKGRPPTHEEKLEFAKSQRSPSQLERYLKDAQDALGEFAGSLIDEERPEIAEEAITGRIEAAAQRVEAQSSFRSMLLTGVISTLISTASLILLAIGIRLFGIDLVDGLQAIGALE